MEFLFFSASDAPLFARSDAESANYTPDEMTLTAEFPFLAEKEIQRGQRIGFTDEAGVFLPFEIRKVETMEPDHYQRLTAEHIVISELSDEHIYSAAFTGKTAQEALSTVLSGSLWSVGNVTASGVSGADIATGSVWQAVRTIEQSWNVYITPRVTVGASGIASRYLDIAPAAGVWRGVRLSINKNADEIGVIYDDSNVITAMYGYGRNSGDAPLTFAEAVWSVSGGDPADKPADQTYVVDTAATALYGRNGRPRWGYYQNGNVTDAETLLSLTWTALQQTNAPRVTIDTMVRDLYRLGYADQPIRLHDTAIVDVEPIGVHLQLEIVRLDVNLLDPTATWVNIGAYIPNIVYINRETARHGSGGGGGGGRGQTNQEKELSEFETEIAANNYEISLRAYQRDMDNVEEILCQAGISINAQGVITYATDNVNMWQSKLNVEADRIGLVVQGSGANASIKAASIVTAINDSGSSVHISADKIYLNGDTLVNAISGMNANFTNLTTGATTAATLRATAMYGDTVNTSGLWVHNGTAYVEAEWKSKYVITGVTLSDDRDFVYQTSNGTQHTIHGSIVTGTTGTTIYYLGHT